MRGTIIIILVLLGGVILGFLDLVPQFVLENDPGMIILYILLFCVGVSVGSDEEFLEKLKGQSPKLIFIPIVTITGTLIGTTLISPFLINRTLADCLAVGSGFGYYSLSSILITELKGTDLGVIALLSNIIREVSVLVFAPLMVRYFGKLAPICCGGATSMDSTLPFIIANSGKEFAVVSIIHGVVVDFSVPFLVSFFCSFQ
ncbi:MAG: lysine exporter LysO family protein [Bacteroidales bacterium]|nr:lysine exporter LysO family protein [Bacteroidales bacterium]